MRAERLCPGIRGQNRLTYPQIPPEGGRTGNAAAWVCPTPPHPGGDPLPLVIPEFPMSAVPPPPGRRHLSAVRNDEYFERQATPASDLPDPTMLIENLAAGVVEVLGGVRDLEQLGRWLSEGVYRHLLRRSIIAARGRAARGQAPARPFAGIGGIRITYPAGNVVEATVLLHGPNRTRAVAIRLEGMDSRWRATALAVL